MTTLVGVLTYAATLPPAPLAFTVERQPGPTILRNFYGLERNAFGAYRWSKPEAVVSVPINAPGRYRFALTLGGGAERALDLYINGSKVGSFTAVDAPREYAIDYTLTPRQWATDQGDSLTVEWQVPAFIPPGEQRALGMVLYGVALTPTAVGWPEDLLYLAPNLFLVLLAYAAARLSGLSSRVAFLVLLGAVLGFGALAALERGTALFWSYQAVAQPGGALTVVAVLVACPLLIRATRETMGTPPPPVGEDQEGVPSAGVPRDRLNFWARNSWPILPVTLLGATLRFWNYDRTNLWFDEGATIRFAKLPWSRVLGLHGAYDFHPPLYYALVKVVTLLLPPAHAGRILSVILGTLTIVLLYALAVRLVGRQAAIFAGLTLAVSPLHIWFSQEARMYVPSVFLVGLSYLALVASVQATSWPTRWGLAALYGLSTALSMYFVYSSLYGLLPQLLIFGYLIAGRDRLRRARELTPLVIGGIIAVLAYIPWIPIVLGNVAQVGDRSDMLGPTPLRVRETILALIGSGSIGTAGGSYYLGLWHTQPAWRVAMFLSIIPLGVFGILGLVKRSVLATMTTTALLVGTIVTTILVSNYSPGYAARTIIAAVLGWALFIGAGAVFDRPRGLRLVYGFSFVCLLALSLGTLKTMHSTAYRQHYREAVAGAAQLAPTDYPIVPVGYLTAFFDAYAPDIRYIEREYLQGVMLPSATRPDTFWILYGGDHSWEDLPPLWRTLDSLGYRQLMHQHYGDNIYLDLVALPQAQFGTPFPIPAGFTDAPRNGQSWQGSGGITTVGGDNTNEQLVLTSDRTAQARAWLDLTTSVEGLYVLSLEASGAAQGLGQVAILSCLSAADETLALSTPARVPVESPSSLIGEDWQPIEVAVICPNETSKVRIALENSGPGVVRFRQVKLDLVTLVPTTRENDR